MEQIITVELELTQAEESPGSRDGDNVIKYNII